MDHIGENSFVRRISEKEGKSIVDVNIRSQSTKSVNNGTGKFLAEPTPGTGKICDGDIINIMYPVLYQVA